jgi:GMP synthase (glutamine-hydrolysing)
MPNAVAIRHVAFEDAGLIEGLLTRRAMSLHTIDAGVDDILAIDAAEPDLLVVLGGPIGVYDEDRYPFIGDELSLIDRRLASGRPLLGICLGAQLIARAAGSRVYPGPAKEIGYALIDLNAEGQASCLAGLQPCGYHVLHWHGDTFDLPAGAVRLASTEITENQAFSMGPAVLGLQFHIEVEPRGLERWLIGHAVEIATAGLDVRDLRRQGERLGPAVAEAGIAVLDAWLDGAFEASS